MGRKLLVITGASGFVGRMLVPYLTTSSSSHLLVGRDQQKLAQLFPALLRTDYGGLPDCGRGFNVLIHLAASNNSSKVSPEEFRAVNVTLLADVIASARQAGVPNLVNVTSLHALTPDRSAYAASKAEALSLARASSGDGITIQNLFLPAVYGDHFAGRLSLLNRLPLWLRNPILTMLSAMVPTLNIKRLADYLAALDRNWFVGGDVYLSDPQSQNPIFSTFKRLTDWVFALSVIALFWWLLIAVWLAVRATSKGPGIFAQERVGRGGEAFTCYKFRTMREGTRQAGTHEVSASHVTPLGALLRRTKLDELPQVWNILRGELSLVGPRPCLPVQNELIVERRRRGVLEVLPGITGLAQVSGIDMSDPAKLAEWDQRYVATQCIPSDLKIIWQTFRGRGSGDRVAL